MSTARFNTLENAAGTKTVPVATVVDGSAKAWVNFNGTGTVAIRASFNVSSITDNGTGDYTVNFTAAMADTNYAYVLHASWPDGTSAQASAGRASDSTKTTSAFRFFAFNGLGTTFALLDSPEACVSIFR